MYAGFHGIPAYLNPFRNADGQDILYLVGLVKAYELAGDVLRTGSGGIGGADADHAAAVFKIERQIYFCVCLRFAAFGGNAVNKNLVTETARKRGVAVGCGGHLECESRGAVNGYVHREIGHDGWDCVIIDGSHREYSGHFFRACDVGGEATGSAGGYVDIIDPGFILVAGHCEPVELPGAEIEGGVLDILGLQSGGTDFVEVFDGRVIFQEIAVGVDSVNISFVVCCQCGD